MASTRITAHNFLVYNESVLAEAIIKEHWRLKPELERKYNDEMRMKCLQDVKYHLSYLGSSILSGHADIFADYVIWAAILLKAYNVPKVELEDNLQIMRDVLVGQAQPEIAELINTALTHAIAELKKSDLVMPDSFIKHNNPHGIIAHAYLESVVRCDRNTALGLIDKALSDDIPLRDIYLNILEPVQYEIGRLWQENKLSVAQEHYCSAVTSLALAELYKHIKPVKLVPHTVIAACVGGEQHEIGIRMVSDFFEMAGWTSLYLGANMPANHLVKMIEDKLPDIVALSVTMPFNITQITELIEKIKQSPVASKAKIIVGGRAFNNVNNLWKTIGADAYAPNASKAIEIAKTLLVS